MKKLIIALLMTACLQASAKKITTTFKVVAQCGECKDRIEAALDIDGISFAELNLETKEITVRFNDKKMSEDDVHSILNKIGYHTDKSNANMDAQKALPACCQPKKKTSCCTSSKKCSGSKK